MNIFKSCLVSSLIETSTRPLRHEEAQLDAREGPHALTISHISQFVDELCLLGLEAFSLMSHKLLSFGPVTQSEGSHTERSTVGFEIWSVGWSHKIDSGLQLDAREEGPASAAG